MFLLVLLLIYLSLSSLGSHSCDSVIWDTSPLTTTRALHTNQCHSARTISHFSSVWNSLLCRTSGGPRFHVIDNSSDFLYIRDYRNGDNLFFPGNTVVLVKMSRPGCYVPYFLLFNLSRALHVRSLLTETARALGQHCGDRTIFLM